jgi:hypothetical protein
MSREHSYQNFTEKLKSKDAEIDRLKGILSAYVGFIKDKNALITELADALDGLVWHPWDRSKYMNLLHRSREATNGLTHPTHSPEDR